MSERDTLSRSLSRRRFLQVGAAGMAAVTLGQVFGLSAQQARAAAARQDAGVLRVAWGGGPATLDPLSASADTEIAFLNAVYDYLIDTDAASNLVPRLAASWTVSDDGLTYTLQLVDGATFHDGSPLTPADVVWTFERLQGGGPTADLLANVTGIEAGDGGQVIFTLSQTNPDFLYNLTDNHAVILQANAEDIGNTFNGTGPFVLSEYRAEDRAIFDVNMDYWGDAPAISQLEFVYFGDTEAAVNALREGDVDAVLRMDNITFMGLAQDDAFSALNIATNGHDLVRLRADREPGSDERVRTAFKMATDREAIFQRVQLGYGALGRDNPIGPLYGMYYTEEYPLQAYDPAGAKALLADAGYPDGLEMTLYVPNLPDRVALAQALAAQWAEAGINITIEPQEEAVYYADSGWLEVDLGITPWGSRPVPQLYLDLAYKTGAVWNEAHFSDEELDAQIEIAGTSLVPEERTAAYHEIQRILIERGPVIIPYFFAQFGVWAANIQGVDLHPFAGRTNFQAATL